MSPSIEYPIISIPPEAREDTEQLGSKPKFWVTLDGERWLFKEARPNTGEDWAEKIGAEIAKLAHIEAADVELASFGDKRGCISKNFISPSQGQALVHGNELLASQVSGYDKTKVMKQSDHNVPNIISAASEFFPNENLDGALTQLAEYMVLDAVITNTDRHHENWGLRFKLAVDSFPFTIAPSFDHASSLGRECLDSRAESILKSDEVGKYVLRARGGVYWRSTDAKGANPLELVRLAASAYPKYFEPGISKVSKLNESDIRQMLSAIPPSRISAVSRELAYQMIIYSLNEIRRFKK